MAGTAVAPLASSPLAALDQARALLDKAEDVTDVKAIRDRAEALRVYASQASAGLEVQNRCAELKLRAERKAGELLAGWFNSGNSVLPEGIAKMQLAPGQSVPAAVAGAHHSRNVTLAAAPPSQHPCAAIRRAHAQVPPAMFGLPTALTAPTERKHAMPDYRVMVEEDREAFVDALRRLANFYDTHPTFPVPYRINVFVNGGGNEANWDAFLAAFPDATLDVPKPHDGDPDGEKGLHQAAWTDEFAPIEVVSAHTIEATKAAS